MNCSPIEWIENTANFNPRTHNVPAITAPKEINDLLHQHAVVAVGVSGGKDSQACALAVNTYLNRIGHKGPRVLIHADLGRVEWSDSLKVCNELATHLGWELIVVSRQAGDLLHRWQSRWQANLERYTALSCVKLILPWSTPSMRFCTSELKSDIIARSLRQRYPTADIINVTGIRREESATRKRMPEAKVHTKLQRKNHLGYTWNAIIDYSLSDVLAIINQANLRLHEAYTGYLTTRVSCVYCIMSTESDLVKAASNPENHHIYREMVALEAASAFAFQGNRWLADIAPNLLDIDLRGHIAQAKERSLTRRQIEAQIPDHLCFEKGWPRFMPSVNEAQLLARVRSQIQDLYGLSIHYTDATSILQRYSELMSQSQPMTKHAQTELDFA